jgi:hypothetical protein
MPVRERKGRAVNLTTKQELAKIKLKALRMKIWFRALSKIERAIVDLTIKCVETVRSNVLTTTISTIVAKILNSFEEIFLVRVEKVGRVIAKTISALGEQWGNESCSEWKNDEFFVRFLGISALNQST